MRRRLVRTCRRRSPHRRRRPRPPHRPPTPWTSRTPPTIAVDGHGYGHGRGMSQYGAAARGRPGRRLPQIVEYYYPGTGWGDGRRHGPGLDQPTTCTSDVAGPPAERLEAPRVGGGTAWDLTKAKRGRAAGGSCRTATGRASSSTAERLAPVPQGPGSSSSPRRAGRSRSTPAAASTYRGVLRSVPSRSGNRITVNVLPMEPTCAASCPRRARRRGRSTRCAPRPSRRAPTPRTSVRTRPTRLRPLRHRALPGLRRRRGEHADHRHAPSRRPPARSSTYGGEPAFTEFSASNGGWTRGRRRPYLARDARQVRRPRGTRATAGTSRHRARARGRLAVDRRPHRSRSPAATATVSGAAAPARSRLTGDRRHRDR